MKDNLQFSYVENIPDKECDNTIDFAIDLLKDDSGSKIGYCISWCYKIVDKQDKTEYLVFSWQHPIISKEVNNMPDASLFQRQLASSGKTFIEGLFSNISPLKIEQFQPPSLSLGGQTHIAMYQSLLDT